MHAFLMGSLGEHGLRRLAKVVDQAEQTVHAILLDQVCVWGGGWGGPGRADSARHTAGPGRCVCGRGGGLVVQTVYAILLDQVCVGGGSDSKTSMLHDA